MSDEPTTAEALAETAQRIHQAARAFSVTVEEAAEAIRRTADIWLDSLRAQHPECFDEQGQLRENWLEIINR